MRKRQRVVTGGLVAVIAVMGVLSGGSAGAAGHAKLTKAQADTKAASALPDPGEVGSGFQVMPFSVPETPAQVASKVTGCESTAKYFVGGAKGGAGSADRWYHEGFNDVFMTVVVFDTARQAKANFKGVRTDSAQGCASELFARGAEAAFPGADVSIVQVESAKAKVRGAVVGIHGTLRFVGAISGDSPYYRFYVRRGRATASVTFSAFLAPSDMDRILGTVSDAMVGL